MERKISEREMERRERCGERAGKTGRERDVEKKREGALVVRLCYCIIDA